MWAASCTFQRFCSRGKSRWYPCDSRPFWPRSRSGLLEYLCLPGDEPRNPFCPVLIIVTVPTEISRLLIPLKPHVKDITLQVLLFALTLSPEVSDILCSRCCWGTNISSRSLFRCLRKKGLERVLLLHVLVLCCRYSICPSVLQRWCHQ
jgi:hypothetical protein